MGRSALLAVLLVTPLLLASAGQACGVPCGRIYPLILIQLESDQPTWPLTTGVPVDIPALLTYKFDMMNEGYTVATPNEPITIRFEYPRKPDWVDIAVEPEVIDVDVTNPTMIQPDPSTPTSPQAQYVFSVPITIRVTLLEQAVLRDGYDFHKLLVFAKSTESGLYQAGYGIKEIRAVPDDFVHEADVAGLRDVFTASPLPALAPQAGETSFGGTSVTVTPPEAPAWWAPAEWTATVSPAPAGRMVFAVHDETGALVASTAPLDASAGEARMNLTLAKPGRHTATLTLVPDAGTMTPPVTYVVPFDAGELVAEGFVYLKTYLVTSSELVPAPLASSADPLAQFTRDIPFYAFETAQGVSATLTLRSTAPGGLPLPLEAVGRSATNLQFSIHDPDGNVLAAGSVDPSKPTWGIRVGSLPLDGWYVLRVSGVGAPLATGYDVRIEATYAAPPIARNRADGSPDATGPLLTIGGVNLTLPLETLAVWSPSDITPTLDSGAASRYLVSVYDSNGTLAYASGLREGAASFSAPAPGTYTAYVYAEPILGDVPFSPVVRAFTFDVGAGSVTIASTFAIDDGFEAPLSPTPTLLGFHAVRVLEGASEASLAGGEIVDAEGNAADANAPGVYYLRVAAASNAPQGEEVRANLEQTYATPVSMEGPNAPPTGAQNGLPIPGVAIALALLAVGLAAVGVALFRRG